MYKTAALLCLLILALTGCAGRDQLGMGLPGAVEEAVLFGDPYILTFETSVSLLPLARGLAGEHTSRYNVLAVGVDVAMQSITQGSSDIALFGGAAPAVAENVRTIVIGSEVIYLITGTANPRQDISLDEVFALFIDGSLFDFDDWDDWDDEDWDDGYDWYDDDWDDWFDDMLTPTEDIALTQTGTDSRALFEDLFHLRDNVNGVMQSLIPEDANTFESDQNVIDFVRTNHETIGVIMATSLQDGVSTLSVDGVYPGRAGYIGQREVILAYRTDNPHAAEFVEALLSGAFDSIFSDNGVVR